MFKKLGKIGLAVVLVIGLLPMMSLRAYAAVPSFNEAADFVIEPPVTYAAGKVLRMRRAYRMEVRRCC